MRPDLTRRRRTGVRRWSSGAVVVALLVAAVATGRPAQALAPTPVFAPYLNYDVGKAKSVAIADFTGDVATMS